MTPESSQRVVPMLTYEHGAAAMDWLIQAFGFTEGTRLLDDAGRLLHGEVLAGGSRIMLADGPDGYQSPATLRGRYGPAQQWLDVPWIVNGVLVYVPDLDGHARRATQAGAVILSGIEEGPPGRRYRAADVEGQRWYFFEELPATS